MNGSSSLFVCDFTLCDKVGNLSKKDMAKLGQDVMDVDTEATVSDEEYEGKGKGRRAPKKPKVGCNRGPIGRENPLLGKGS